MSEVISGGRARHYGFMDEELEFIIHYDVKCRMGAESEGKMSKPLPASVDDVYLSSSVTVRQYRLWESQKKSAEIAQFIHRRFDERFLTPFENLPSSLRSGFAQMAVCCLMIETLESFYNGWKSTNGVKGEVVFEGFFTRVPHFHEFQGKGGEFYTHIRCGILHQAETTGGWLIRRSGALLDYPNKTINANKFMKLQKSSLDDYYQELASARWKDKLWRKCCRKMNAIIKHCEPSKP